MGNFGRNYPVLVSRAGGRADERERLFFFAAAGLAAFLFFTVIFVLNFKDRASAKQEVTPEVAANQVPAAMGTLTLLAPEKFVRAGTKLTDIRFKEVYWPRNQVPNEAVRDMAELRDMYASADIPEGMPVQRNQLTREALNINLPLTPGNRAVTIEIDATSGIEGWAMPGSRVDVVLTYTNDGELTSKVIVQNARVISLSGESKATNETRTRGVRREARTTITLDVSPEDALGITTAREMGHINLLMRAPEDNKSAPVEEMKRKDFDSTDKKAEKERHCTKGTMKMGGQDYIIGCDGKVERLDTSGIDLY